MNSIYECKDGRVRIYIKDKKKVMSYPKFLMEQLIGRELEPNEEVHHKVSRYDLHLPLVQKRIFMDSRSAKKIL